MAVRLKVVDGPDIGNSFTTDGESKVTVGSHAGGSFVLSNDPKISRFHFEIRLEEAGAFLRDLGSLNGTLVDGVLALEVGLRSGSVIRAGDTTLQVEFLNQPSRIRLSTLTSFGGLLGQSVAMRQTFAGLERAALSESTVLLQGESGTGKEEAALAIHQASDRGSGPFVVIDCGALQPSLVSSELFGHVAGAFTGAQRDRVGAFEQASGGTVMLDEIGELGPDLQKMLLRVLEDRTVQPVGATTRRPIDVRVIAATHRDLRGMVNAGTFRSDLFYRLGVLGVELPSLRQRPEDIPLLVEHLAKRMDAPEDVLESLLSESHVRAMQRSAWPGNVRQLRNHVEVSIAMRSLRLEPGMELDETEAHGGTLPFQLARRVAISAFERKYLHALMERVGWEMPKAIKAAGVARSYLYRMLQKHQIKSN